MKTLGRAIVFLGGSRTIGRVDERMRTYFENIIRSREFVVVGDADGIDAEIQRFFSSMNYAHGAVHYSARHPRNHFGAWLPVYDAPPVGAKGYAIHAAKDRAMAGMADRGVMIWNGRSTGTILNVLRLLRRGKPSPLYLVGDGDGTEYRFEAMGHWRDFIERQPSSWRKRVMTYWRDECLCTSSRNR